MRKVALVFALAVFVPSLVLAWLAVRSLRDQHLVLERQEALLYEQIAETLAKDVLAEIEQQRREFAIQVEALLAASKPRELAPGFHETFRHTWPLTEVGFAVSLNGQVIAPSLFEGPDCRTFRLENDLFLTSRETAQVYWQGQKSKAPAPEPKQKDELPSKMLPEQCEFKGLVGDQMDGTLARFLQNQLKVLFWHRSPLDPEVVFGAQVDLNGLIQRLQPIVKLDSGLAHAIAVALLDDTARPKVLAPPNFKADWRRPFVAAEIGDALPHWKVGVFMLNPARLHQSARTLRLTVTLLIVVLLLAIAFGSWLIVNDLKRQLALARQKTDFVSNVSHELKTPLTSIRMFSELLADNRVEDPARQRQFLRIITAETARLTRLINNVLDFSRMERGEKTYKMERFDLRAVVEEICTTYRPHLEEHGFHFECATGSSPVFVKGDRDALAQVLVNLLSNAEKYSADRKEIRVELNGEGLSVLDRGLGVPSGCEQKIFEQFFRAHDSLASGIEGSGLGLTLAQQIIRAHGGSIHYESRTAGGSCFTVRIPHENENPGG
ncbi:MAG TPA: HAMP domain-containing sensor histidine kinase [Verrucomicrobiae bacterium]|nr:HAMP domain-containing sensor histidine kinase [Verrucomicrobiae bacterium]